MSTAQQFRHSRRLSHHEQLVSLGILAAGIAHEINNPLASILTGLESLRRSLARAGQLPEASATEVDETLQLLENAAVRCSETTTKLLHLAQPAQTDACWTDLNQTIRDTLSLLSYATRRCSIVTIEELDPELPFIWASESGMRSVTMNLCLNAVQAMGDSGTLTVRTRKLPNGVELLVSDTGPGIPSEIIDRMWDPFFTTKPAGMGTGLGLSITHGIVVRHGGRIGVQSGPDEGARFTIWFPVRREREHAG
jgi:two-component system, NtrC family, sensor kinase